MAASRIRRWFSVLAWMGFIFYMSCQTGDDLPSLFPYQSVAYHIIAYAVLGALFARAVRLEKESLSIAKIICLCAVFGLLYGVSDEYHQTFISGRSADVLDLIYDTIGSAAGGFFIKWLK